MVIGHWLLVIGGAYGAVASINKSTVKPCIPKLFTIHYSLFTPLFKERT